MRPSISRRSFVAAAVATAAAATGVAAGAGPAEARGGVARVTGNSRVDRLLAVMTLDEKLSMIEGQPENAATNEYEAGYLAGVPRLGIPPLRLSDGPPGVITRRDSTGMTSTMALAATFSTADAEENGKVIGRDARSLGQDLVLEPFVNLDRDTSWSRGFNTYGEDPLLTARTGAAVITGIQSQGTMAQVKHYIAYDGGNDVVVDSQTLHEVYLQPFDAAVKAGVTSVMSSYNKVNGEYASHNAYLLTTVLRGELGFKGFVTSDWGANHGTTSINAGLDMEMPGGGGPSGVSITPYFTKEKMKAALADGTVTEATVTRAVGRILYQMDRFGLLTGASKHTVTPLKTARNQAVLLRTAQRSATLLKNKNGALPLNASDLGSLALIGAGAGQTIATNSGGEAAGGLLGEQTSALNALRARAKNARITYAVGGDLTGSPVPASALGHDGAAGLVRTTDGATRTDSVLDFTTAGGDALPPGTAATWTGTLTVPTEGDYWLNIQALGATGKLVVDGRTLTTVGAGFGAAPRYGVVHATDGNAPTATTDGLANGRTKVHLKAGPHTVSVTAAPDVSGAPVQIRLNWVTPEQAKADHDAAVAAARKARTAVVFVWNTGSGDLSAALPDDQDQLVADIAAVNTNTIVVLQANQPVALPWLDKVNAVLDTYFGGDQAGVAAADILLGAVNPSGRLPFTWPKDISQEVAHDPAHPERSSKGVDGVTTYSEGINIGYRHFEATGQTPLFPFGYGLSYTTFRHDDLRVAHSRDGGLDVTVTVTNTGRTEGTDVVQVYLGAPRQAPSGVQFAPKALAAYERVTVKPGRGRRVTLHIAPRQLRYWSDKTGWTLATGPRDVLVGASARDIALSRQVNITGR
ncbi:beta-glucosidase family protein [Streptomyces sp. 351MFTsu5.1]|uniref:beta-glucosidase family protein n=1 Tax=Streptomyces sp. 351MFTsu5.1 TaxID=1172180 RepID=UPI0003A61999|nr:glycoside hydrolase family 3 C-terminal domain-containing protein [Streptomyces sp. 351MFTsu5.1]